MKIVLRILVSFFAFFAIAIFLPISLLIIMTVLDSLYDGLSLLVILVSFLGVGTIGFYKTFQWDA